MNLFYINQISKEWTLNFSMKNFNMLDPVTIPFYSFDRTDNNINLEELSFSILMEENIDIDKLLEQLSSLDTILPVLRKKKDLCIEQKIKLLDKLNSSSSIFLAITTFSKDELESLVKIPEKCTTSIYQEERPYTNLCSLLIGYLYLYPSEEPLSKEQTIIVHDILKFNIQSYCLPLITTERFLSNFSKRTKKDFFIKWYSEINKRLFLYINEIPNEWYEQSLKNVLNGFIPIKVPLYAKCFHKDFDSFLPYISFKDFISEMDKSIDLIYALVTETDKPKDILTIDEYHKCIQRFFKQNEKEFYKELPKLIKNEVDNERKNILEAYYLMKDMR